MCKPEITDRRGRGFDLGKSIARGHGAAAGVVMGTICALGALVSGCKEDHRSVGSEIRHVVVRTVVDQGLTLDQKSEPTEVVYALLCAIRDDYAAGEDGAAREAAFDRQLALCAPDHIFSRVYRRSVGRDDAVQRIVWRWAPTLGHYRDDFPTDWESARARLVVARTMTEERATGPLNVSRVLVELGSPSGEVNASVVAQFQLVREQGYWRVAQVGFAKKIRHLTPDLLERLKRSTSADAS